MDGLARAGESQQVDDQIAEAARIVGRFLRQPLVQIAGHSHRHNYSLGLVFLGHRFSIRQSALHS